MANTIRKKAINELHTDTRILYNTLESKIIKEGNDSVSYDELSKAIGRDVRQEARGLLNTARKHIEREHHITLEVVRNEGIKKTTDYCGLMEKTTGHIGKQGRRTVSRVLNAINGQQLNSATAARLSQLGAINLFTRPKTVKRLEEHISSHERKELATAETLKLFTNTNQR